MAPRTRKKATAPRNRKKVVALKRKRNAEESEDSEAAKDSYRTISDLPNELLHMIMSQVHRMDLKYCSLTCRVVREVAVEYLSYKWPQVDDLAHFLAFMRNHPRPRRTVLSLRLCSNSSIDAKDVADIKLLFKDLGTLRLETVPCLPPSPRHPKGTEGSESNTSPLPLSHLRLSPHLSTHSPDSYMNGVMYTLSLFEPKYLYLHLAGDVDLGQDSFDARCLAGYPAVQHVWVTRSLPCAGSKSTAPLIDALSKTLSSDSLRSVSIDYDSRDTLKAYRTMFERICSNITTLKVCANPPYDYKDRAQWVNPLDGELLSSACIVP